VVTRRFDVIAGNTLLLENYLADNMIAQPRFPLSLALPPTQAVSDWLYFDLPDDITLALTDIDASGNVGGTAERTIHEIDDVAPPTPDASGLVAALKEQV